MIGLPLQGDQWQNEKRSVVQIVSGVAICTGTILNSPNTPFEQPLVLTAYHCKSSSAAQVEEWCLILNYEHVKCDSSSQTNGPFECLSGLSIVASNEAYDLLLLRLDQPIPAGKLTTADDKLRVWWLDGLVIN